MNLNFRILSMSSSLTLILLGGALYPVANAQLDVDLDNATDENADQSENQGTNSTNTGIELMALKAQLKPDPNEFLAKDGWYQVKNFVFVASNGSEICASNSCKYSTENTQFSPDTYSGGYVFEGRLKVTTTEDNIKKSKFYDFRVDLNKASEEENNGKTTQFLEGTFGLGKDKFNPEIVYDITNGTLLLSGKSPILTIQAERAPL
jgi:hypothetical protein